MARLNKNICPEAKIKNIHIKYENSTLREDDPHLDDTSPKIIRDMTGEVEYVKPDVGTFSSSETDVVITINVTVPSGTWEKDEEYLKYLRVQILQSTNQTLSTDIFKRNIKFAKQEYARIVDSRDYKIVSLVDVLGNINRNLSFTFTIPKRYAKNLTYFTSCFIDVEELKKDFEINLSPFRSKTLYGQINTKSVYKNGVLQLKKIIYKLPNGEIYFGPVHVGKNGEMKTGRDVNDRLIKKDLIKLLAAWTVRDASTAGQYYRGLMAVVKSGVNLLNSIRILLDTWTVRDTSTAGQYYSDLKDVFDRYIVLSGREKPLEKTQGENDVSLEELTDQKYPYEYLCQEELSSKSSILDKLIQDDLDVSRYFSNVMATFGSPVQSESGVLCGPAKLFFSFDYLNILRNVSVHSCLLYNTNSIILGEILKFVQVKSIKVYRQEITEKEMSPGLFDPVTEDFVVRGTGNIIRGQSMDDSENIVATIRELTNINLQNGTKKAGKAMEGRELSPLYRHFTIQDDYTVGKFHGKEYCWVVSVIIEDNIKEFIKLQISRLMTARRILALYYDLAQLTCSYNKNTNSFTSAFIQKMYSAKNPTTAPWLICPTVFADVFRCFVKISDEHAFSVAEELYKLLEPKMSNPGKINETILKFRRLEDQLMRLYDISFDTENQTASNPSGGRSKTRRIEIRHNLKPCLAIPNDYYGSVVVEPE